MGESAYDRGVKVEPAKPDAKAFQDKKFKASKESKHDWNHWGNRDTRFEGMQGLKLMQAADIWIYGCGAIGRSVALCLSTMGCARLTLVDADSIQAPNLGTQGWRRDQFQQLKCEALAKECKAHYNGGEVTPIKGMIGLKKRVGSHYYKPDHQPDVVFCCVDDMVTRNEIFKTQYMQPKKLIVDARMGAFAGRVICDKPPFPIWENSLFADSAAFTGRCTLQATFFAAQVASGYAVDCFAKYCNVCGEKSWAQEHLHTGDFEAMDFLFDLLDVDITHTAGKKELTKVKQLEGNVQILKVGNYDRGGVGSTIQHMLDDAKAEEAAAK